MPQSAVISPSPSVEEFIENIYENYHEKTTNFANNKSILDFVEGANNNVQHKLVSRAELLHKLRSINQIKDRESQGKLK